MSSPIRPPLTIETIDGATEGRPITTIKVSNGDLTVSGTTATIDTTGSGGVPGGSTTEIQYNNAGAFAGDAGLIISNEGGGVATNITVGEIKFGGNVYAIYQTVQDGDLLISPEGTGVVAFTPNDDAGGTKGDMQINLNAQTITSDAIVKLNNLSATTGSLSLEGSTDTIVIENEASGQDIDLRVAGAGIAQIKNTTTNQNSILTVLGNGTGTPKAILKNASMEVDLTCEADGKLYIRDPTSGNRFILDASGAATGITFPDSTVQTTAASGNVFNVELPGDISAGSRYIISQTAPFGSADISTNFNTGSASKPLCYPFIAPESGGVSEIGVNFVSTAAGNLYVAIYDSDANGMADTRLCYATIPTSSSGNAYQTTITGTGTLVRGTQYWYTINVDSAISPLLMGGSNDYIAGVGIGFSASQDGVAFSDDSGTAYAVPPTSFTSSWSQCCLGRPVCSLKIS